MSMPPRKRCREAVKPICDFADYANELLAKDAETVFWDDKASMPPRKLCREAVKHIVDFGMRCKVLDVRTIFS